MVKTHCCHFAIVTVMNWRACTKEKLTFINLCSPQVVSMQVWGCEVSSMVMQASADNTLLIGCPSRSDVLGIDTNMGAKMCIMVQSEIGELT